MQPDRPPKIFYENFIELIVPIDAGNECRKGQDDSAYHGDRYVGWRLQKTHRTVIFPTFIELDIRLDRQFYFVRMCQFPPGIDFDVSGGESWRRWNL